MGDMAPPMVIFCIDISASMSTNLKLEGGSSMTRLQCVQAAVAQQLEVLQRQQPECVVVIVTFGAEVCVYTDSGNRALIARRAHDNEGDLLSKGQELASQCSEQVVDVVERLATTVAGLQMTLIAGAGVSLDALSGCEQKGSACIATHTVGTATAKTDLTQKFNMVSDLVSDRKASVPLQLQL